MAAATRLIRAALALLVALAAAGASSQPRAGARADSILAALEATDVALFARVIEVRSEGDAQRADVRVLETVRGALLPDRIAVRAGAEALLVGDAGLAPGETVLLLAARAGDELRLPAGLRQAKVTIENSAQQAEARALVRGYLDGLSDSAAAQSAFDVHLRHSVATANPRLRTGVHEDLSHRLRGDDASFLLRLARQSGALLDVRVFAMRGLAALPAPAPAALAELLRPAEPVAVRQAVIDAFAAHGQRDVVERGLADPSEEVRRTSVDNLASPESVAVLERHFAKEPARAVRLAIVRQLGLIGTEPSREALRAILASTPDPEIHRAAQPWLRAAR